MHTNAAFAPTRYRREFDIAGMVVFPSKDANLPTEADVTLYQLEDEGYAENTQDGYRIAWDQIYRMLDSVDYPNASELFDLPPISQAKPSIGSYGSLIDTDFSIYLSDWLAPDRKPISNVTLAGGLVEFDGQSWLLPQSVWRLLDGVQKFRERSTENRNGDAQRLAYAQIRAAALEAGAVLDNFLVNTIVLTPEKLNLQLRMADQMATMVVEVIPGFDGAPHEWIANFDKFSRVQKLYNIPTDTGIIQVVVSDDVTSVLEAIKALPGRRIVGAQAEAFLINPVAALGVAAARVIDEQGFAEAKQDAGIVHDRFIAFARRDHSDRILQLGIRTTPLVEYEDPASIDVELSDEECLQFIGLVRSRLASELPLCGWQDFIFELDGDSADECNALEALIEERGRPYFLITETDIYDLSGYSDRIEGIGVEKPTFIPGVTRPPNQEGEGWLPKDIIPLISWVPEGGSEPVIMAFPPQALAALKEATAAAAAVGETSVTLPGIPEPIPLGEANNIIQTFDLVYDDAGKGDLNPPKKDPSGDRPVEKKPPRLSLLIKGNIESIEYIEARRELLSNFDKKAPRRPRSLKSDVELKDHQIEGLAWLQHLFDQGPSVCRGALLADDMGLGKTLQLLCLIASLRERDPSLPPALIVAPLSLLENWKGEVKNFFQPNTLKILTAYGEDLARLRVPRAAIQQNLLAQGLNRFLKPNWCGDADVVLTTYETLRDLQFSFARENWSLMICDEAQKIKTPSAEMTKAAKKQKVQFRIACTGTPVENSLTDLWSLFDFVQPGMLGALNEFSRNFKRPIEAKTDEEKSKIEQLRALIEPQILRRMKKDVAKELKSKIEIPSQDHPHISDCKKIPLSMEQRALYGKALALFKTRNDPGSQSPFKEHLGLLHYLRIICTDPHRPGLDGFVPEPLEIYRRKAPKLDWLIKELERIKALDEKVIVFCEFKNIQRLLKHYIYEVFGTSADIINGETSVSPARFDSRQKRIEAFQDKPGFGVIILSPVAVGFGVNIQAANHVIHYTRTWNPAKEDQASDRAYRIGQKKDVYVYCPTVWTDDFITLDVHVDRLLTTKRALAGDMLNGSGDINLIDWPLEDIGMPSAPLADEAISIEAVMKMNGPMFEAFTAALWMRQGHTYSRVTAGAGDRGVDVVAISADKGVLIQCKSSTSDRPLTWDAVKEVVGGRAYYQRTNPRVDFELCCVTNSTFNEYAHAQALENNVKLVQRQDLEALLSRFKVRFSEVEQLLRAAMG